MTVKTRWEIQSLKNAEWLWVSAYETEKEADKVIEYHRKKFPNTPYRKVLVTITEKREVLP